MKITDDMLTEWRQQFEAELQLEAAIQATEVALSKHEDGTYRVPAVQSAWWGYQTARRTTPDREAWQPIETAPRDGTPIIGCTFHPQLMHLYAPCTIFWAAYHPNSEGEKTWRTSAICGNKMKGVTHWMPLPAAPTSAK